MPTPKPTPSPTQTRRVRRRPGSPVVPLPVEPPVPLRPRRAPTGTSTARTTVGRPTGGTGGPGGDTGGNTTPPPDRVPAVEIPAEACSAVPAADAKDCRPFHVKHVVVSRETLETKPPPGLTGRGLRRVRSGAVRQDGRMKSVRTGRARTADAAGRGRGGRQRADRRPDRPASAARDEPGGRRCASIALVAIGMFALGMVQKLPCYDGGWFFGATSSNTPMPATPTSPISMAGVASPTGCPVLRPAARRHGVPRIPRADRRFHGGRLLADAREGRSQHPNRSTGWSTPDADGLRRRPHGVCRPYAPAPALGRSPRRARARRRAHRHHQLGPAGHRSDRRRHADVVPQPPAGRRHPDRAGDRGEALSGAASGPLLLLCWRAGRGARSEVPGRCGGGLAGGQPAGDDARRPGGLHP